LKAGEWFRRGRLIMVSPVHGDYRRCQAEIPLIILCRFPGPALCAALATCFIKANTVARFPPMFPPVAMSHAYPGRCREEKPWYQ
jgi:hypothetical protein